MFNRKPEKKTELDELITRAIKELDTHEMHTKEYAAAAASLSALYTIRNEQSTNRMSKDTLAIVLGNLAGIVVIVGYEQAHVLTSKALQFIKSAK